MGLAGYVGQRVLLNRVIGKDILPPILVTFGLSIVLQNALLETYSADSRRVQTGWLETASVSVGSELAIGILPLLMFVVAVCVIGALHMIFYHTSLGRLLRATPRLCRLWGAVTLMPLRWRQCWQVAWSLWRAC
jgi:branched-chain amino acid transport system permease protein